MGHGLKRSVLLPLVASATVVLVGCQPASIPPAAAPRAAPTAPASTGVAPTPTVKPAAAAAEQPRYGGTLEGLLREPPPSFSIYEDAGVLATLLSASPAYNNLVAYDPAKDAETSDTIIPDLAERWEWGTDGKTLTFYLRRGVMWHDGTPFTSKDVQVTYDTVRDAPGIPSKPRSNPRKLWLQNVASIDTPEDFKVVFHLKQPQPGLLAMLASGQFSVMPAHIQPVDRLRKEIVGTGPFRIKDYQPGQVVTLEKNKNYFKKGLPYLDGIRYIVIRERATQYSALQAGRVHMSFPQEQTQTIIDTYRKNNPNLVIGRKVINVNHNLVLNHKKAPFDNLKVRQAVALAVDRAAYIRVVRQGAAVIGTAMLPTSAWGLPERDRDKLPGYGPDPEVNRARAKRLLEEAGYSSGLQIEMNTRALDIYRDLAVFAADQLKRIGIETTLKEDETTTFLGRMARKDYILAPNVSSSAVDDPDAWFFEHYSCASARNFTAYCNSDAEAMFTAQSMTVDPVKRRQMIWQIDQKLTEEVARPIMGWWTDYMVWWPQVRGFAYSSIPWNRFRHEVVWLAN